MDAVWVVTFQECGLVTEVDERYWYEAMMRY